MAIAGDGEYVGTSTAFSEGSHWVQNAVDDDPFMTQEKR